MSLSSASMWPIMAAVLFGSMGFTAMVSVLGPVMRVLSFPDWYSGALLSVAGLFVAIFSPIWSKISKRYGQKITLWIGLLGQGLALICFAMIVSLGFSSLLAPGMLIAGMVFARSAMSAFYASVSVSANSWVAERTIHESRTQSLAKLGAAQGVGMIIGPVMAAFASRGSLLDPLWFSGVIPLLAAVLVVVKMPDIERSSQIANIPNLRLRDPRIRLPILTAFACMIVIVTAQLTVGFIAIDFLGQTTLKAGTTASISLALLGVCIFLAQVLVSRTKLSPGRWIQAGALLASFGVGLTPLLLLAFPSVFLMWSGLAMGGFGVGLIVPAVQSAAAGAVSLGEAREAAGLVSTSMGIATVIGPIFIAIAYSLSPVIAFLIIAMLIFGIGFLWRIRGFGKD